MRNAQKFLKLDFLGYVIASCLDRRMKAFEIIFQRNCIDVMYLIYLEELEKLNEIKRKVKFFFIKESSI